MSADIRDPRFATVVGSGVELQRLGTGYKFTEGPLWHPREKFLLFSDMPGNIIRLDKGRGRHDFSPTEQHGERPHLRS